MSNKPNWQQSVASALACHGTESDALLPVLHAIQREQGHIAPEAIAPIAEALNLSRAEIHGVLTFYHEFRTTPGGRHRLQLCRAEACQAQGARALETDACQRLGIAMGATDARGQWSLDAVYCLGNCATGPCVRIDDEVYGRVTPQRLGELLSANAEPQS